MTAEWEGLEYFYSLFSKGDLNADIVISNSRRVERTFGFVFVFVAVYVKIIST